MSHPQKTLRILCIDGGGMRGIYTSAYLHKLANVFASKRGENKELDIGKAFDLIVGTSTGGIIACSLAMGISQSEIYNMYLKQGKNIFPKKMPDSMVSLKGLFFTLTHSKNLKKGDTALRQELEKIFRTTTLAEVYQNRGIALSIPAVELATHQSYVFKTKHLSKSYGRDDSLSLVDVCMATSAAPLYRSLCAIPNIDGIGHKIFADGGLWANNPILVGLIDALRMSNENDRIELYSIGNCAKTAGENMEASKIHRDLFGWRAGADAVILSIDAQESAFDYMTGLLIPHFKREIKYIRFPKEDVPANYMPYLDLDESSDEGLTALKNLAERHSEIAYSRCEKPESEEIELLCSLFNEMPLVQD